MQLRSILILCFACVTTLFAAPKVQLVPVPEGGAVPDAETDAQGTIHVTYVAGGNVFYARSTNDGASFSSPLRVNSEPDSAHPPNMFRGPDIALGKNGRPHVIWYSNGYQRKLPKDQWGVHYAHLNDAGTGFTTALNLNHRPSDNYSIAASRNGRVAVFWMADGLFLSESKDGGKTFAGAEKIPVADSCECCASRALFMPEGTLLCAYRDKEDNVRDMFLLLRPEGSSDFTRAKLSITPWQINACPMTGTFVALAQSGTVVAWETRGQVYFARCDSLGRKTLVGEVSAGGRGGKWPIALSAPDNTVLVTWKRGKNVEWQLFDANDKPTGTTHAAPARDSHRHAAVVTRSGDFRIFN